MRLRECLLIMAAVVMILAWSAPLAFASQDVLLVSEFSGKLLFVDAAATDPEDAVIAAVPLAQTRVTALAASPDGALAFVAHNPPTGPSFVSVVDIGAVLNDTDPGNDLLATITIPRTPSLAGHSVSGITELHVSPDSARLAVTLSSVNVFSLGIVYLIDVNPASGSYLTIVDSQSLNANLVRPAFRPGSPELWVPNGLGIFTSGSEPGIHVRDGVSLNQIANIPNFGRSEAFAAPVGVRFDADGRWAVVPQGFNGYVHLFNAATRARVAEARFGSVASPSSCAQYGTSFPQIASLSPDATRLVAALVGSRPFNFGCGPLTSAVHGVGFVDVDPNTGALSNVGTLALEPAVDGSLRNADVRFSPDGAGAFVLTTLGVHKVDANARARLAHFRLGVCSGETLQDLDSLAVPVGAPRRIADYRDLDHDGQADSRCDPDPPSAPPVAQSDVYAVDEDGALNPSAATGVLANDTVPEGNTLAAVLVNGPSHGILTLNADGSFTYTPALNYNGQDGFTYQANDGSADSDAATVTITVNPVNDAPVAHDQTGSTDEDMPVGLTLSGSDVDGDSLTFVVALPPSHGTLSGVPPALTYTPAPNFNGSDSLTFTVDDGHGGSDSGTFSFTVDPVNDAPVANDDAASAVVGTPQAIGVLANDTDIDGDALVVAALTQGTFGSVVNNGGDVTYTADNVFGPLIARIGALPLNDGQKNSLLAKLRAAEQSFARGNRTAGGNQLGALTNELEALKRSGRLDSGLADALIAQLLAIRSGSLTDTFSYTVSDGHGGTEAATVTVTVSW